MNGNESSQKRWNKLELTDLKNKELKALTNHQIGTLLPKKRNNEKHQINPFGSGEMSGIEMKVKLPTNKTNKTTPSTYIGNQVAVIWS